jgi:tetratricopeptide (TPR) repeat protein
MLGVLVVASLNWGAAWALPPECGSLQNAYGPFDYRDPVARAENLPIVELNHFTPDVENLVKGKTGYIAGDLDYTLRAFPNHHRALNSMARLALRVGNPQGALLPVTCYFERAVAWRPDDPVVRMIYGNYLSKTGHRREALANYLEAQRIAPDDPEVNYNLGLMYVSIGEIEKARACAKVAYDGGYPLPGLRNMLAKYPEAPDHR